MTHISQIRALFAEEIDRPDAEINLARAALLIGQEEYPRLNVQSYLRLLDEMAGEVKARRTDSLTVVSSLEQLNQYLFVEWGFKGNTEDYYDPKNSFVNQVIDRRKGIPITLSLIYMEVGWRLGLALTGIGFPGHFLVKARTQEGDIIIDPFNRGKFLQGEKCRQLLLPTYSNEGELLPANFNPTRRQILTRMLGNLRGIYSQQYDHVRTLAVLERLLLLNPDDSALVRDRGRAHYGLKEYLAAHQDFKTYLQLQPDAEDAEYVKEVLRETRLRLGSLN